MTAPNVNVPTSPARTGVLVGIAAITLFFAALTSALVFRQGGAADWQHFRLPPVLYLNSLVLILSSVPLEMSRSRAAKGGNAAPLLIVTLGLGLLFVAGQFVAWRDLAAQGLYLATSPSSAFFYVFTVVHALHVLGGLTALLYVLYRIRETPAPLNALGAAALYWHFMSVLWLYLLLVLFLRV